MFRKITEEERRMLTVKGKTCEAKDCSKEIDFVHPRDFSQGGGANLASYYCAEHSQKVLENE